MSNALVQYTLISSPTGLTHARWVLSFGRSKERTACGQIISKRFMDPVVDRLECRTCIRTTRSMYAEQKEVK